MLTCASSQAHEGSAPSVRPRQRHVGRQLAAGCLRCVTLPVGNRARGVKCMALASSRPLIPRIHTWAALTLGTCLQDGARCQSGRQAVVAISSPPPTNRVPETRRRLDSRAPLLFIALHGSGCPNYTYISRWLMSKDIRIGQYSLTLTLWSKPFR